MTRRFVVALARYEVLMQQIMRWHTRLHLVIAVTLTVLLIVLQSRLYWPSAELAGPGRISPDLPAQLRFLRGALERGTGEEMQTLFPEGYFFSHVLYGLAWTDIGVAVEPNSPLRRQALAEATWAAGQLDTSAGRAPFSPTLDPPFGVFFVGWSAFLRGGLVALAPPDDRSPADLARLTADCEALADAFARSPTPFLSAYPGQAWPVDSVVGMAALARCETLLNLGNEQVIADWVADARERLDPATGLLPHRVDPRDGRALEGARGSSQSIIVRFLPVIEPAWGLEQYQRFRAQFVTTVAGVPGVREYPHGQPGMGDVDSGPLLAGVSLSASTVTLGAARMWNDRELAESLRYTGEWLGLGFTWDGERRYAFGVLPVGDAFLAWAQAAPLLEAAPPPAAFPPVVASWWRLPAHGAGLTLLLLIWFPALRRRRRTARS
jgi:hypothetical protein